MFQRVCAIPIFGKIAQTIAQSSEQVHLRSRVDQKN
jgi:hypothetical protein